MKLALFAFSRRGCDTARRVRGAACGAGDECRAYTMARYAQEDFEAVVPPLSRFTGPVMAWADAVVFVGACGIAVRAIAPYVADKRTDPAVLVADEGGQFVISLLSGHIGGANELTRRVAGGLGATGVITTATDVNGLFSADAWAARQGLAIDSMRAAKAVSAAILERPVPLSSDFPVTGPLPAGTQAGERGAVGICVSWRRRRPFSETLLLVPPVLHVGLGCRRGTPAEAIRALVEQVLEEHAIHPRAVKCAASIDLKAEEPGLLAFCREKGWPVRFHSAGELAAVEGAFTPSAFVRTVTGVDNVCERAALLGAERLLVKKTARDGVTVAVAAEHWEVRFG